MSKSKGASAGKGILFSVWLAECVCGCPGEYRELIARYGSAEEVYNAKHSEENDGGIAVRSLVRALNDKSLEKAEKILNYCLSERISVITPDSDGYPTLLRELRDLPAVLYVRGTLPDLLNMPATAVVGTRRMTAYGMRVAYNMGYGLAEGGSVVVSGMAAGGDSLALCGALDAGGTPIAVLGCGVDRAYPAGNAVLMEEIAARGAVISEYSPGSEIRRQNFPQRNRIISGLSRIIAVTEAGDPSGALITAQKAIQQGKNVFAVPGTVGAEGSVGVNNLLKNGASVLTCPTDILNEYAFLYSNVIKLEGSETKSFEQACHSAYVHRVDVGTYKNELAINTAAKASVKPKGFGGATAGIKHEKNDINITKIPLAAEKTEKDLSMLDGKTKEIYLSLPEGDFSPDDAVSEKYGIGEILCALTVLEINSLVSALPGGRYGKKR